MPVLSTAPRRVSLLTFIGAFLFLASTTFVVRAALPDDAPIVISDADSTRAIVTTGPVRRLGPSRRVIEVGGRATFYVTNLSDLLKGEGATAFRADIQDENGYRYPLEIVSLTPTAQRPWVYALTVRLHEALGDVGDT